MEVPRRNSFASRTQRDDERLRLTASLVREQELSTPFYFFEESELDKSLDFFSKYLPSVKLYYAVKSNPHPLLVRYFAQRGLAFDAASAQETELVRGFGVPGEKIILTNPNKQTECVRSMFEHNLHAFAYDNIEEAKKIAGYAARQGIKKMPKALLRIRIESQDVQIDLNKKFGCSLEDAGDIIKAAWDLGIETIGLAFHTGTQSFLSHNYVVGIKSAILVARAVKAEYGIDMRVIDIGGGFPDQRVIEHVGTSYETLFSEIATACEFAEREGFELYAEPGRLLVSGSGNLVTSVIGVAERSGKRFMYLNDGIFGCYSGKFHDYKHFDFYPVAGSERRVPFSHQLVPYTVWGPTCDSMDLIEDDVLLPADMSVGDYMVSCEMGAYSLGCATNYNGFHVRAARLIPSANTSMDRSLMTGSQSVPNRVVSIRGASRKRARSREALLTD